MRILKNLLLLGLLGALTFGVLEVLIVTQVIDDYSLQILCMAGSNIMIGLSLNLISGFTGQLALGHAGFLAVGAYSTGILLIAHVPLPLAILGGALMTAFRSRNSRSMAGTILKFAAIGVTRVPQ